MPPDTDYTFFTFSLHLLLTGRVRCVDSANRIRDDLRATWRDRRDELGIRQYARIPAPLMDGFLSYLEEKAQW